MEQVKTNEEIMKYLSNYEWKLIEIFHDKLTLARDLDRNTVACNIADAYTKEIEKSWKNHEDFNIVAERLYKKYYEANKDELDYYPQKVENPKIGDLVMAVNGFPKTDDVYAIGKIVKITRTVTNGDVYWLEGSYSYFTTIIKPNSMYKHLNTKDWDDYIDLCSKYIDEEFNNGFTYKTMDKAKLNEKSNEIYETLRNKENH